MIRGKDGQGGALRENVGKIDDKILKGIGFLPNRKSSGTHRWTNKFFFLFCYRDEGRRTKVEFPGRRRTSTKTKKPITLSNT